GRGWNSDDRDFELVAVLDEGCTIAVTPNKQGKLRAWVSGWNDADKMELFYASSLALANASIKNSQF
ncbi:MAG: hypothetical protein V3W37_08510, partial [Candidatus Binatia bacterium]